MAFTKPSIVVVMGSFQLPWQYRYLKASLEKHGYTTTVVNLPSTVLVGDTPIADSFDKDVQAVRKAVTDKIEQGHDVVVWAHSQGGVAASVALRGLGETGSRAGVRHVVFLSCWLVEAGITGREKAGGALPEWLEEREGLESIKGFAKPILYNDVPDALAENAARFIFPKTSGVNDTKVPYVCWHDVPLTYVVTEKDCALLPAVQKRLIESCKLPGKVLRLDAGHSPFLGMPERVAGIVRWAAGEEGVDMEGVGFGAVPEEPDGADER